MFLLTFLIVCICYIAFISKYVLLENIGEETEALITSKQDNYMTRVEASGKTALLKAMRDRHRLLYNFDTQDGKRVFGNARVNDFMLQNTMLDDRIPVLYLPAYPKMHCLKPLLLVRFRELMKLGLVILVFFMMTVGLRSISFEQSAPTVPQDALYRQLGIQPPAKPPAEQMLPFQPSAPLPADSQRQRPRG